MKGRFVTYQVEIRGEGLSYIPDSVSDNELKDYLVSKSAVYDECKMFNVNYIEIADIKPYN